MGQPLLPIDHQTLMRSETADVLRGLAEMIEQYPAERFILSVQLEVATSDPPTPPGRSKKKAKPS